MSALRAAVPGLAHEAAMKLVPISTSGEWRPDQGEQCLTHMGGHKGLFAKELQQALQSNVIDIAVHSLKDMENFSPKGLTLAAYLPRHDARDAFLSPFAATLDQLPQGSVVGTASVRRKAQLLAMRPDLQVVPLRGNVDTRLEKLWRGQVPAAVMAYAGLARLGHIDRVTSIIPVNQMVPAVGQGVIAMEIRESDEDIAAMMAEINHAETAVCVAAERAFVAALNGSCQTPIGGLATLEGDQITLTGFVASVDGTHQLRETRAAPRHEAANLGRHLAHDMLAKAPWWTP